MDGQRVTGLDLRIIRRGAVTPQSVPGTQDVKSALHHVMPTLHPSFVHPQGKEPCRTCPSTKRAPGHAACHLAAWNPVFPFGPGVVAGRTVAPGLEFRSWSRMDGRADGRAGCSSHPDRGDRKVGGRERRRPRPLDLTTCRKHRRCHPVVGVIGIVLQILIWRHVRRPRGQVDDPDRQRADGRDVHCKDCRAGAELVLLSPGPAAFGSGLVLPTARC